MAPKNTTYSDRGGYSARAVHAKGKKQFSRYDTSAIDPKQGKSKGPLIAVIVAVVALVLIIGLAVSFCSSNPNRVADGQEVEITFSNGSTAAEFGDKLTEAGLINNTQDFMGAVQRRDVGTQLKPGTYVFVGGMSVDAIIDDLVAGPGIANRALVIPEGNTIDKTAEAVAAAYNGTITADEFKAQAHNADQFKEEFPFVAGAYDNSLEGFLFPKTYEIVDGYTAQDVIKQMLTQFNTEVENLNYSYAEDHGLTPYQALILASVVEREAASDNQKEVASVFYNRLGIDIPLQSDATTAYVVGGDPTPDDLKVDGPFNTYLNKGLPAGPICSPGLSCIEAVLDPAQTNYYYFVFYPNDNGGMDYFFNETYEGHQQAIADHAN